MFYEVNDFDTKRYEVIAKIKKDITAADLKITIFIAACKSARTQVECKSNSKCLINIVDSIPGVPMLLSMYSFAEVNAIDKTVLNTLHWLMAIRCDPKISTVKSESHKEILESICEKQELDLIPDYMFKVDYCPVTKYASAWKVKKAQYSSNYGFQVVTLEDCFNKLFSVTRMSGKNDKPLSLNSNLKESYHQTKYHESWCRSQLGYRLKVLLISEFINHPNLVSVQRTITSLSSLSCIAADRGKTIVIADSSLVRYSYILVYKERELMQSLASTSDGFKLVIFIVVILFIMYTISTIEIKDSEIKAF